MARGGRRRAPLRLAAALLLLGLLFCPAAAEPSIRFTSPEDGSTLWIADDRPVHIAFDVAGVSFPIAGHVGLLFNGRDSGARLVHPPFNVSIADLDEGKWTVQAVVFDASGRPTPGEAATVHFMAKHFLELMEHDDFPVAAEHPRAGDASMNDLPGIASWEDVPLPAGADSADGGDGAGAEYAGPDERLLRRRWARNIPPGEEARGQDIFGKYASFHHQVFPRKGCQERAGADAPLPRAALCGANARGAAGGVQPLAVGRQQVPRVPHPGAPRPLPSAPRPRAAPAAPARRSHPRTAHAPASAPPHPKAEWLLSLVCKQVSCKASHRASLPPAGPRDRQPARGAGLGVCVCDALQPRLSRRLHGP